MLKLPQEEAEKALDERISWASGCRISPFPTLQRSILKLKDKILTEIELGLSNGRIEFMNTEIRLMT